MMGKKKETEIKHKPCVLAVGDNVITPVSERQGKITKIVETPYKNPHGIILYGDMQFPKSVREYTVELKLPCLHIEIFKTVILLCEERELKVV